MNSFFTAEESLSPESTLIAEMQMNKFAIVDECKEGHVLGMAYKKGVNRTERWRHRHCIARNGCLLYFEGPKLKGWTSLVGATVTPLPGTVDGRGLCFDVACIVPVKRTYLFSAERAEDIELWKEVVRKHSFAAQSYPSIVEGEMLNATTALKGYRGQGMGSGLRTAAYLL